MSNIYTSMDQIIGRTPLVRLEKIEKTLGLNNKLLAKLEYFNPAGSTKDRIAKAIIDDAEKTGRLLPGGTIVEPTSGNTGIGLCAVGISRGYRVIIVMPEDMSEERKKLIRIYGGELVETSAAGSIPEAIAKAEEIAASIPGSILAGQFVNQANPLAHYENTGRELWEDADGDIDIFTAGIGTGGTITGIARYRTAQNKEVQIVALEPANSALLAGGSAGPHAIQGIGDGLIPDVLDTGLIDGLTQITDEEAIEYARLIAREEGYLVGISSGAALASMVKIAKLPGNEGKTIAALFADSGMRYFSTELFE
ncbi:MAG: cysteine synthase A [Clostridia bacterium]|nr:cysteine synthase A [Clostridia bacterium]